VDCKAQTTIVGSDMFFSFIDKTKSIYPIDEIFSKREQIEMQKRLEPAKPVHKLWVELHDNDNSSMWDLNWNDSYSGPEGGPKCGPSNAMRDTLHSCHGLLVPMFLLIFPLTLLKHIANVTNAMHTMIGSSPNKE